MREIGRHNEHPGVDAGWPVLFAFQCPPPCHSGRTFGDTALALRVRAGNVAWQMSCMHFRQIIFRRVRLREDLKPIKASWHRGPVEPDWLFITHITGQRNHDFFELQSVKVWSSVVARLTGSISYETLPIAKGQAHADVGVEYVEWEPCKVEITNPDGSIDWGR